MKSIFLSAIIILFSLSCSLKTGNNSFTDNKYTNDIINYVPKMVGPEIISRASFEGHASITPNGKEIYFAVYSNDHRYSTIAYSEKKESHWAEPQIASFSGKFSDGSPALSPDGKKLFFSSNRPTNDSLINPNNDIWFVERSHSNKWGTPIRLPDEINTPFSEFSPSVDKKGNLYFCSNRSSGYGDMDVYFAKYSEGEYHDPVLLNDSINSKYHEGNVAVSPNGTQLFVMVQNKPDGFGYDDIYYSVRINEHWSKLENIGSIVNTSTYDFSPKISPDGKIMYFSSRINRDFNSPDSKYTYKTFQEYLNSPLNGFGNIFSIEIERLNLKVGSEE